MKTFFILSALLGLFTGALHAEKVMSVLKENEAAPVFMLPSLDGERVSLRDFCGQLRNPWKTKLKHIIVLSFMASYCVPCRHEIPQLEAFAKEAPEDVKVIYVTVDTISNEAIAAFIKKMNKQQMVLSDRYGNVMKKYGVQKLPSLFILDKEGNLFFQSLDGLPQEVDLKEALNKKIEALRTLERGGARPPANPSIIEVPAEKKVAAAQGLLSGKPFGDIARELNLSPAELESLKSEIITTIRENEKWYLNKIYGVNQNKNTSKNY